MWILIWLWFWFWFVYDFHQSITRKAGSVLFGHIYHGAYVKNGVFHCYACF